MSKMKAYNNMKADSKGPTQSPVHKTLAQSSVPKALDLSDSARVHMKSLDGQHISDIPCALNKVNAINLSRNDSKDDSNGEQTSDQEDQGKGSKRNPKCARCANHERTPVAVKGHKRKCPYKDCKCKLCLLTVKRRELMAETIREKRRQKEDLSDSNVRDEDIFLPPVIKKQKTDDCSSETDRDSGYSTEDNERPKPVDNNFDKEFEIELNHMFSNILEELRKKLTDEEIVKTLLKNYLKNSFHSIKERNIEWIEISDRIIESAKHSPPMESMSSNSPNISQMSLKPKQLPFPTFPITPPGSSNSSVSSVVSPTIPDPQMLANIDPRLWSFPVSHYGHPMGLKWNPIPTILHRPYLGHQ